MRTAFLSPRPQAEETEKPSELSKRCEKHILIQADDREAAARPPRPPRQNTFFLSADRKNVFSLRRTSDVRDVRVAGRRCSEALLVCPADAGLRGW